jgi:uncharacterized membrane protein YhaH (DUF805 family)
VTTTFERLFGLRARIPRGVYLAWGFALAALKFALDTAVVYGFTHKTWTPLGYVIPSLVLRSNAVGDGPTAMHVILVVLAMPFLWVGLSMSVRRAADAGVSPWLGVGFLVPVLNYLTIAVLGILPGRHGVRWEPIASGPYREDKDSSGPTSTLPLPGRVRSALLGVLASVSVGLAMTGLSVYGLGLYGTALFFLTPFTMGAVVAALYNAGTVRKLGDTVVLTIIATTLTGCILLLFAIEGALCLAMAYPIALGLSLVGAILGRAIVVSARGRAGHAAFALAALPGAAFGEASLAAPPVRDVSTSIEIAAPPEAVWPHVIGFSDLPEPPAWQYRLGIAYPMRARIDGQGVGAIRRCEFSTGAFVEPITAWDPPRRLAFDVTSQPPSMKEWSPYAHVNAPHVEGYLRSTGGEFRLTALHTSRGERTLLEGTTHYTLSIYPEIYWRPFAEALLHGIHARVLRHIKALSESETERRYVP